MQATIEANMAAAQTLSSAPVPTERNGAPITKVQLLEQVN